MKGRPLQPKPAVSDADIARGVATDFLAAQFAVAERTNQGEADTQDADSYRRCWADAKRFIVIGEEVLRFDLLGELVKR